MSELWKDGIERMLARVNETAQSVQTGFPHWADPETGKWTVTADGDWTGGYWVAMLWIAHRTTGIDALAARARELALELRKRAGVASVFKAFPFYYGGTVGTILANDQVARESALIAAHSLVELYNPRLRLIPLGTEAEEGSHVGTAETSIDSLLATPFLLWVAQATGDAHMREVALNHGARVIALHQRDDGSFIQSTSLDPSTGDVLRHYTHKGYSDSSRWARAQSWGVLLSVMSYIRSPQEDSWLAAAERGADWWIDHVPADYVSFWDFDDPAIPHVERDTSATAAMCAAMLKLSEASAEVGKKQRYRDFAEKTARALVERYLTPVGADDKRPPGILTEGCFNKRSDARSLDAVTRHELIFGSYYLFEALHVLDGRIKAQMV